MKLLRDLILLIVRYVSVLRRLSIQKRAADLLEKICVGSFIVGLFQGSNGGIILAIIAAAGSFWLTLKIDKKEQK
ncbi:hypothetical protein AGMMS50229_12810 [Campylobacterota bacterium]|nr:hypothetical protein AGMMS50229_12810 [Campylobacterota bacterium]